MSQTATFAGMGAGAALSEAALRCQRRIAELRQTIVETVTKEHIAAIIRTLAERAAAGSETAAKLVLQYAVGRGQGVPKAERDGTVEATVPPPEVRTAPKARAPAAASAGVGRALDPEAYLAAAMKAEGAIERELRKMADEDRRKAAGAGDHRVIT